MSDETEKFDLGKKVSRGDDLHNLVLRPEWRTIQDIFVQEYLKAWTNLVEKESEKDRAIINALEHIYKQVTNGIVLGDIAREKFEQKFK